VPALTGARAAVIPDRIEVGTLLLAALATRGEVTVTGAEPAHLQALVSALSATGVDITCAGDQMTVRAQDCALVPHSIETAPFPAFPTDLQAQWMSAMATLNGAVTIAETVFENRFMHVPELLRMGAQIEVHGPVATVHGGRALSGAPVMATDLRASAGLVIAGLAAEGVTDVLRIYHLDRGYAGLDAKLCSLGARVSRFEREATAPRVAYNGVAEA